MQKAISTWLIALWCLGSFSPIIFYAVLEFIIEPHFGLPEHKWLYLTLLAGFSACACAATLMQVGVAKRIGFVFLGALTMAIQLAAIVIYVASHFPEPT